VVSPARFAPEQLVQGVDGLGLVGVGVQPQLAGLANAPIFTREGDTAEQVGPDCHAVKPRLIGGLQYRIHQVLDLEAVLVHDSQAGELKRLKIGDLTPVTPQAELFPSTGEVDLVGISDAAWQTAQERFAAIRPLLSTPHCTRAQVAECARLAGVTPATIYRWLKRYQRSGRVSALVPSISSGGRGQGRLSLEAEAIVSACTKIFSYITLV
jgi:hypothetical protein